MKSFIVFNWSSDWPNRCCKFFCSFEIRINHQQIQAAQNETSSAAITNGTGQPLGAHTLDQNSNWIQLTITNVIAGNTHSGKECGDKRLFIH